MIEVQETSHYKLQSVVSPLVVRVIIYVCSTHTRNIVQYLLSLLSSTYVCTYDVSCVSYVRTAT